MTPRSRDQRDRAEPPPRQQVLRNQRAVESAHRGDPDLSPHPRADLGEGFLESPGPAPAGRGLWRQQSVPGAAKQRGVPEIARRGGDPGTSEHCHCHSLSPARCCLWERLSGTHWRGLLHPAWLWRAELVVRECCLLFPGRRGQQQRGDKTNWRGSKPSQVLGAHPAKNPTHSNGKMSQGAF